MALAVNYMNFKKTVPKEEEKEIVHCRICKYKGAKEGKYYRCKIYSNMLCEDQDSCKSGAITEGEENERRI